MLYRDIFCLLVGYVRCIGIAGQPISGSEMDITRGVGCAGGDSYYFDGKEKTAMNREEAEKILAGCSAYTRFYGRPEVCVDGWLTPEELEAIAWLARNGKNEEEAA